MTDSVSPSVPLSTQNISQSRNLAILEVLLCILISTAAPTLTKVGLNNLSPLTIVAGRFTVASLVMMPFLLKTYGGISGFKRIPRYLWVRLGLMGICCYLLGYGIEALGLTLLPASTVGFMGVLIPLVPIFISIVWMKEIPTRLQYAGMAVVLLGTLVFLYPFDLAVNKPLGLGIILISMMSVAVYNLFSRLTGKNRELPTLAITALPMMIGCIALWVAVLVWEGLPEFSWQGLGLVLWLGLVNSVAGSLLYNHAFRSLSILEMGALVGLLPITSAIFPVIVLHEPIAWHQLLSMLVVVFGVIGVQVKNWPQKR